MSEHDKGQQGQAGMGRPMPDARPATDQTWQGTQGQPKEPSPMNQIPPQGWQGGYPGGPQAGMTAAGMQGPNQTYPGPAGFAGQPGFAAPGPHPGAYAFPPMAHPGVDPYWAYHAQAAYAPPPYPYAGMAPPPHPYAGMPWPGYGPGLDQQVGQGRHAGGGQGAGGPGMAELVDEIAKGGNGLSSLTKLLNVEDSEFWKGALLGAAAVLLLTNDSVQGALFKTGARTKAAVKTGVERVKERVHEASAPGKQEAKDV